MDMLKKLPSPPNASPDPKELISNGRRRIDPFWYLRDLEDTRTKEILAQEEAYAKDIAQQFEPLRSSLFEELKQRMVEDEVRPAHLYAGYWWNERWETGKSYCIHERALEQSGQLELVLDENELASEHAYFDLGLFEVSTCGHQLAYATDVKGDELYTIIFKNLKTGKALSTPIENTAGTGVWDFTGKAFYYVVSDDSQREYRVFKHVLGNDVAKDELIFEEPDPTYSVDVYLSADRRALFIASQSKDTNELWVLELDQPESSPRLLQIREKGIEYWGDKVGATYFLMSNEGAPDFKLISKTWDSSKGDTVLIPGSDDYRINGFDYQAGHLLVYLRREGLEELWSLNLDNQQFQQIKMPEQIGSLSSGPNEDATLNYYLFYFESPLQVETLYKLDLASGSLSIHYQAEQPKDFDPSKFVVERHWATQTDAKIPMTLIRALDPAEETPPVYLYGYGAYGEVIDPGFRSSWVSLLNRGYQICIAHPRGGAYLGDHWYQSGRKERKPNSFSDFLACADYLCDSGLAEAGKIAVHGCSAGGLLVGGALNQNPSLFKVAFMEVPFLDVLNTMLDPSLPLTTLEYEEWGNPEEKTYYDIISGYSPYETIQEQAYPSILLSAGLNDSRVSFWEPLKWAVKARQLKTSSHPIVYKLWKAAGHGGVSGRYESLEEIAFNLAFLLHHMES